MSVFIMDDERLTLPVLKDIIQHDRTIQLADSVIERIVRCRQYLDFKLQQSDEPVYGINTGFGYLQHIKVETAKLQQLQHNLLRSHACGTGQEVPQEVVQLMLFLKIRSLAYGHSGVALSTVQRLVDLYNHRIFPVVYTQGSLGASGDLAPLAHLALPLLGEGEVWFNLEKISVKKLYQQLNWKPLTLQSKEGLALINGTQFMSAYGIHCLLQVRHLSDWSDCIAALSIDAFDCRIDPFLVQSHTIRPHKGQLQTAENIRNYLKDSELILQKNKQTQDPYSFRCVPQVHGASKDTIRYVEGIFETEINSVTDNPNIFPEEDLIISAGNFHGQALALGLDFLAIALAELGSISERRVFQLISGNRGLPLFLVKNAGLNSGLMIAQYTAASIASQNKQLCTPASVDSIVSSNGQEDHVSMGANAATKCLLVVENLEKILAIELLTAAQALDFRRPLKTSDKLEQLHQAYRKKISFNEADRLIYLDIEASREFITLNNLNLSN